MTATIRDIFYASRRSTAELLFSRAIETYAVSAPSLADLLEAKIPQELPVFSFLESRRRRIGTAIGLQQLNREIQRSSWAA